MLTIINEWYIAACAVSGVRSDYASFIPEFMESSGFVNINREEFNVPIGEWPTDGCKYQSFVYCIFILLLI